MPEAIFHRGGDRKRGSAAAETGTEAEKRGGKVTRNFYYLRLFLPFSQNLLADELPNWPIYQIISRNDS